MRGGRSWGSGVRPRGLRRRRRGAHRRGDGRAERGRTDASRPGHRYGGERLRLGVRRRVARPVARRRGVELDAGPVGARVPAVASRDTGRGWPRLANVGGSGRRGRPGGPSCGGGAGAGSEECGGRAGACGSTAGACSWRAGGCCGGSGDPAGGGSSTVGTAGRGPGGVGAPPSGPRRGGRVRRTVPGSRPGVAGPGGDSGRAPVVSGSRPSSPDPRRPARGGRRPHRARHAAATAGRGRRRRTGGPTAARPP